MKLPRNAGETQPVCIFRETIVEFALVIRILCNYNNQQELGKCLPVLRAVNRIVFPARDLEEAQGLCDNDFWYHII